MASKKSCKKRGPYGKRKRNSHEDSDENMSLSLLRSEETLSLDMPEVFTKETATSIIRHGSINNETSNTSLTVPNYPAKVAHHEQLTLDLGHEHEDEAWMNNEGMINDFDDDSHQTVEEEHFDSNSDTFFEQEVADEEIPDTNELENLTLPLIDESTLEGNSDLPDIDSSPLYPGASITLGAFMLLIALFTSRYNVIGDGVQQLLNIIALALPNGHLLCTSLHAYKNYFRNLRNPLCYHYYCIHCLGYLEKNNIARCTVCNKNLNKSDRHYFLEMPVTNQIQNLFGQTGFYNSLQERFKPQSEENYKDITDGSLYKSMFENHGLLSYPQNISFVLNTDGAPVFKSSKVSIWPVFLVINELPYQQRMMKENMILAALWFGSQKPSMSTFLKPLLHSFKELSKGVKCVSPDVGEFVSKAFLIAATADLPARSMLCNSMQYNGAFGCWKCLQRGETASVGKGHTHIFPYIHDSPKGPERTAEGVEEDAKSAVQNRLNNVAKSAVNGVKGPSWLSFFPKFDIVHGIAIDYMHGVLLGVQKLLLTLWFMPKHKGSCFSFITKIEVADDRLLKIKPTLNITRLPRSIRSDLKYWKASELRSFLLYYGAPVMYGILDHERFCHYMCLINAMHILLTYGASRGDIDKAEAMLNKFCGNFEQLYDRCYMTLNIHQLLHLSDSVRSLGPLYTHSCFSFEDKNGFILRLIRGTQNIDSQIVSGVSFIQKIPELKEKCIKKGSEADGICNSIESTQGLKRGKKIGSSTYILGTLKKRVLKVDEFSALCSYLGYAPQDEFFLSFVRLETKGNIIYGLEYSRMVKRDNSTIQYQSGTDILFGNVRYFLEVTVGGKDRIYAMVEPLRCVNYDETSNILAVREEQELQVVELETIKTSCLLIGIENNLYICRFPNKLESD